jgi:hypothetical protein
MTACVWEPPAAAVSQPPSLVKPHLSPIRPAPLHFDWAKDAKSLPTTTSSAETYGP